MYFGTDFCTYFALPFVYSSKSQSKDDNMFFKLFILFISVPVIEIAILIDLGSFLGLIPTVALIIFTGALGAYLAKQEGMKTFFAIQNKLNTGEIPTDELIDGVIILAAGLVLLTPGIITDIFGFLLLFKPTRNKFKIFIKSKFTNSLNINIGTHQPNYTDYDEQK